MPTPWSKILGKVDLAVDGIMGETVTITPMASPSQSEFGAMPDAARAPLTVTALVDEDANMDTVAAKLTIKQQTEAISVHVLRSQLAGLMPRKNDLVRLDDRDGQPTYLINKAERIDEGRVSLRLGPATQA
jgi:hypothetical protein